MSWLFQQSPCGRAGTRRTRRAARSTPRRAPAALTCDTVRSIGSRQHGDSEEVAREPISQLVAYPQGLVQREEANGFECRPRFPEQAIRRRLLIESGAIAAERRGRIPLVGREVLLHPAHERGARRLANVQEEEGLPRPVGPCGAASPGRRARRKPSCGAGQRATRSAGPRSRCSIRSRTPAGPSRSRNAFTV